MFSFRCEWSGEPALGVRSGLDLGHMTFTGPLGEGSSRGRTPDQAMMMGPSLSMLLDGLRPLLQGKSLGAEISGVDSSFSISFQRVRRHGITLRCQRVGLGEVSDAELISGLRLGIAEFLPRGGEELDEDAARGDLLTSLQDFERFFPSGRQVQLHSRGGEERE